ncbi:hypothetical protein LTR81_024509 [Elasticomyces elasticus]
MDDAVVPLSQAVPAEVHPAKDHERASTNTGKGVASGAGSGGEQDAIVVSQLANNADNYARATESMGSCGVAGCAVDSSMQANATMTNTEALPSSAPTWSAGCLTFMGLAVLETCLFIPGIKRSDKFSFRTYTRQESSPIATV